MTTTDDSGAVRPVIYRATVAPERTICARSGCISRALVRMSHPGGTDRDLCGQHFMHERSLVTNDPEHPGIVHDDTGDMDAVGAEFPRWHIVLSDSGRLYAVQGVTTVSAYLCGPLRGEIVRAERAWAGTATAS